MHIIPLNNKAKIDRVSNAGKKVTQLGKKTSSIPGIA
jgi:hypothetical protein